MKPFLLVLGFLAALLIIMQLVLGQLIVNGSQNLVKAHQHSGYATVTVVIAYIGLSLARIASSPRT
jgi:hypothetical protein